MPKYFREVSLFQLMYRSKTLVIILLATVALTLIVPAVSGISLLQQANAETSGQNGKNGVSGCTGEQKCQLEGGAGVVDIHIVCDVVL
jgi:hypothetical protein